MQSFSLEEQISCVQRELELRLRVYARNVELGKMSMHLADQEYAQMQAVLETLLWVKVDRVIG